MLTSLLFFFACSSEPEKKETPKKEEITQNKPAPEKAEKKLTTLQTTAKSMFGVLPEKMPGADNDTPEKIALGKELYFEKALSINGTQSCNSCHDVTNGNLGVDNKPTSPGAEGKLGGRNSPSSVNAGFHVAQFWDGRAKDLKEQAKGPILNPIEMGLPDEATALKKLAATNDYPAKFAKVFGENGLTYDNMAEAIAAFERTLISRDRFDQFQNGDVAALSADEQKGLETFISTGCTACHSGIALGGNSYQKLGAVKPYMPNGKENTDLGRYEATKKEADKNMFKVPSLRNVSKTGPYFHDGQVKTLEEAIKIMASIQLGKDLNDEDVKSIATFLNALSGEIKI